MKKEFLGSTDIPAENVEQDLFHIETYINGLSTFIKECSTPMTVSIQGDWGSGKTSMMNMIREKISDEVFPIWFNTWQFSQFDMGNSLVFSMMEVMLDELGCEQKMITKVMNGITGFARKTAMVVTDNFVGGEAADIVGNIITPEKPTNYAREILELKEKFQKAVDEKLTAEKKSRVVVFVDDLDRLQPGKAVELLEVLKLFLECSDCVFVIAVDYDVVVRGIRQKYGEDVSDEKGKSFFDKIIQLPFMVPVAQYDIKNYVRKMLSDMNISVNDEEIELFKNLIQTSIGLNPRSMKRLFNTYQLLDIITRTSITGIDDSTLHKILFAIICMQMGHENLYQYLVSNIIDAEFIEQLVNPDTIDDPDKDIFNDETITGNDSRYIKRLKTFVGFFYKAIQNDNNNTLSESEFANFQSVLKCSSVVSVGEKENTYTSDEMDDRYKNKDIAEQINAKLSDIGTLKIWQPSKSHDDVKISDLSSSLMLSSKEGFDFSLVYYLSRTNNGEINVSFTLYCKSPQKRTLFLDTFGNNPLNLDILPETASWGRIMYSNVITVSDNDAVEKTAELYLKAYNEIQKFL
ncbi:MAG: P-loop NTPase fold protein [Oscillospiraceae bacterium]